MNVTFQSRPGVKNSTSQMKEPTKSKPRRSKKLVVDRIVGGKIMRAKREGSIIKLGRKRSNPS